MLKLTLIDIPTSREEKFGKAMKFVGSNFPPINLIFLGTVAKELGVDVDIIPEHYSFAEVEKGLHVFKPDIVGITFMSMTYHNLSRLLRIVKSACPSSTVVVGGYHNTIYPEDVLIQNPEVDCGFVGEADRTFADFLRMFMENGNKIPSADVLKSIPGLALRDQSGRAFLSAEGPNIENLDELPFLDFDLLPGYFSIYLPAVNRHFLASPQAMLITTRGCPYACTFCGRQLLGRSIRSHSNQYKIDMIKGLVKDHGVKSILFGDEFMTYNKKETILFCEMLIKEKLNHINWVCSARVNNIDDEFCEALKAAGCIQLSFGLETGSNEILKRLKKNATAEQAAKALKCCRKSGLMSFGNIMLGCPGETEGTLQETYDFVMNNPIDYIVCTFFTPLPGSDILDNGEWKQYGTLTNENNFKDFNLFNGQPFIPFGFTQEELKRWRTKIYRDFYFNPKRILRELRFVTNYNSWKFLFRALRGIDLNDCFFQLGPNKGLGCQYSSS